MSSRAKAAFVGSIHRPFSWPRPRRSLRHSPCNRGGRRDRCALIPSHDSDRRVVRCARNRRPRGPGGARRRRRRHTPVRDARRTRKSQPRRRRRDAARRMAIHQRTRRQLENGQRLRVGPEHEPGPGLQQQRGIPIRLRLRRRRRGPVRQILEPGPDRSTRKQETSTSARPAARSRTAGSRNSKKTANSSSPSEKKSTRRPKATSARRPRATNAVTGTPTKAATSTTARSPRAPRRSSTS